MGGGHLHRPAGDVVDGRPLAFPPEGHRDDGYAAQVVISSPSVSSAASMLGGGVVYWDGTLENRGDKTLTSVTVALTFLDPYGKVVGRLQRSLLDRRFRPLPPHAQRSFELGFENLAPEWNQAPPQARAVAVFVR